ncbi:MAG: prephenate dehydrogenase [Candidatus Actinomarinales bacterium]|nr:MAG: prephenate dehydrogenase [Candidatus Actinomarinales bacterium]
MLRSVLIVGLGLMGSNLGLKLRSQGIKVYGEEIDENAHARAINSGVIEKESATDVDLIILAIPINQIINYLNTPLDGVKAKGLIDLGGTKKKICQLMGEYEVPSVGGHPLCGVADNSIFEDNINLYRNSTFILSETTSTNEEVKELALEMVKLIEANPVWLDSTTHDEVIAITSHIPHLISTALIGAVMKTHELEEIMEFTSGGFDGATRLSRTNPDMIWGMLETNGRPIGDFGEKFLEEFRNIFSMQEDIDLHQYIENTVEWRRELANKFGERTLE